MNRSSLAKKLKPAKREWKSFTTKLQSKLQSLNVPKTTTHRFITFCSRHLFTPFKQRFLAKFSHRRQRYNHLYYQYHHQQNQLHAKNFSAVYIQDLYAELPLPSAQAKNNSHARAESSRSINKEVDAEEKGLQKRGKKSVYSVEDAWNDVVAKSPQLRCVDERAEEFIYKFREDMKIQREKSLLEFQEMLSRSA